MAMRGRRTRGAFFDQCNGQLSILGHSPLPHELDGRLAILIWRGRARAGIEQQPYELEALGHHLCRATLCRRCLCWLLRR